MPPGDAIDQPAVCAADAVWPGAVFSLQDIAATREWTGEGVAGVWWCGMYVIAGLVVMLPPVIGGLGRLAAGGAGAATRAGYRGRDFDALRQAPPA